MKSKSAFVCQNCGYQAARWLGRCPSCQGWSTFVEETSVARTARASTARRGSAPVRLGDLAVQAAGRRPSGIAELDRVLGGGVVPGSLILVGGDPGIGKSTLVLQVAGRLAADGVRVLYVSGEESEAQTKLRAQRLGIETGEILLLAETELESIIDTVATTKPGLLVIDSIQTVYSGQLASAPGSVGQVRECAAALLRVAKEAALATFLIGHVTKYGAIAGPRTLEHIVDTVLYFEGERFAQYRILRAVKNRFGSTNEVGIFEMTGQGLVAVENPSRLFLSDRAEGVPGSVIAPTLEGSRPLLVEIQALVAPSVYSVPQRIATGFEFRRLVMLLCVLDRRAGINTGHADVLVNVAGGLRLEEPAADLAVALAVASAARDFPVPRTWAAAGEVGLGGEVRALAQLESRLGELARLGFEVLLLPQHHTLRTKTGLRLVPVRTVDEAIGKVQGG